MQYESLAKWLQAITELKEEETERERKEWEALGKEETAFFSPFREAVLELFREKQRLSSKAQEYERSLEFFREAVNSLPNPVFIKDSDTRFTFFNRKYEQIFGMKREEFIGQKVGDLSFISGEEKKQYQLEDSKMVEECSVVHYEVPFSFSDGKIHESLYWSKGFQVPGTGEKGLIGEIVDISTEKELERNLAVNIEHLMKANKKIRAHARLDHTTGLANRYVLDHEVLTAIRKADNLETPVAVLLADLDHFKRVNDTYGHLTGDKVLKEFAKLLKSCSRKEDILIRYGGEEFLIILTKADVNQGKEVAERICGKLRQMKLVPDGRAITVSIGVTAHYPGDLLDKTLKRADEALYKAKENGRDRVVIQ